MISIDNTFFVADSKRGVSGLTETGVVAVGLLLESYSTGRIKDISGLSRNTLKNYIEQNNRISRRGKEGLIRLIANYNDVLTGGTGTGVQEDCLKSLAAHSDQELFQEVKRRGYKFFVQI